MFVLALGRLSRLNTKNKILEETLDKIRKELLRCQIEKAQQAQKEQKSTNTFYNWKERK